MMSAMGLGIGKPGFIPDHLMHFLFASIPLSNTGKSLLPFPQGHDPLHVKHRVLGWSLSVHPPACSVAGPLPSVQVFSHSHVATKDKCLCLGQIFRIAPRCYYSGELQGARLAAVWPPFFSAVL